MQVCIIRFPIHGARATHSKSRWNPVLWIPKDTTTGYRQWLRFLRRALLTQWIAVFLPTGRRGGWESLKHGARCSDTIQVSSITVTLKWRLFVDIRCSTCWQNDSCSFNWVKTTNEIRDWHWWNIRLKLIIKIARVYSNLFITQPMFVWSNFAIQFGTFPHNFICVRTFVSALSSLFLDASGFAHPTSKEVQAVLNKSQHIQTRGIHL